ncbi:uncharacterized protein LOC144470502 [Augochlora pura]
MYSDDNGDEKKRKLRNHELVSMVQRKVENCLQDSAETDDLNAKNKTISNVARDNSYENLVAFFSALSEKTALDLSNCDTGSTMAEQESDAGRIISQQPIAHNSNDRDDLSNSAVDIAWRNKHYSVVLALLKADSNFPNNFDLTALNGGHTRRELKEFVEVRGILHRLIEGNRLEDVKDYTNIIGGSRLYLNLNNQSALFTAIQNKRFKIYAFLRSIQCVFKDKDEEDCIIKLSTGEKELLRTEMSSTFPQFHQMHIFYLTSKSRSNNPIDKSLIEHFYRSLDAIPEVSIILKVVQHVDCLDIIFDFDNGDIVDPAAAKTERKTDYKIGRIYVAAETEEDKLLGSLANKLTQLATQHVYKNDCNPYGSLENTKRQFIAAITARMREYTEDIVRTMDGNTKETPLVTLARAFTCPEDEQQSGLIARVPQILAQHRDAGRDWLLNTNAEVKLLFDYFVDQLHRCNEFIENSFLVDPRYSIQILNEYLGEVDDLTKHEINFENPIDVDEFLQSNKQVFLLRTDNTLAGVLSVYESLTAKDRRYSVRDSLFSKFNSYVEHRDSIHELLCCAAGRVLCVRYTCDSDNEPLSDVLTVLNGILEREANKKVVFVVLESKTHELNEMKRVFKDKCYEEPTIRKFTLDDLTRESQKKLLKREVTLQEETTSLRKLIGKLDRNAKQMIGAEMLEGLISNRVIRIGSRQLGTTDLEAAYSELYEEVDMEIFVDNLLSESSDIYIISGIPVGENKLIECLLNSDIDVGKRSKVGGLESRMAILSRDGIGVINNDIQVTDDRFEKRDFRRVCRNNRGRKIYWISLTHEDGASKFVLQQIYDPDFYFKCGRFNNQVVIERNVKEELTSGALSETYVIDDKSKEEFARWLKFGDETQQIQFERNYNKRRIRFLKSENNAPVNFQELILENPDQTFHLFKFEQEQLVWCTTHGSLTNLSKYRSKTHKNTKGLIDPDKLFAEIKDKRVVIIAGDLGTGKTTTLIKLCELKYALKSGAEGSMLESHWCIKINLKDHLDAIRDINLNIPAEALKKIVHFLSQADKSDDFARGLLGVALVKHNFGKPLLIAFDGFDEVLDKSDRNKIVALLAHLKDATRAKFWITTRLHYQQTLESTLSTFAVKLGQLDDETMGEFVAKYLKNRLTLILSREEFRSVFGNGSEQVKNTRVREYAVALLNKMRDVFKGNTSKHVGTLLRLCLMLEGCEGHFKTWAQGSRNPDFSYLGDHVWEVYENYINRKYDIYFKKAKIEERLRQEQDKLTIDDYHKALSKSFFLRLALKESLDRFRDMVLSVGIVRSNGRDIDFAHSTFRDYFAAKVILNWTVKWKAADRCKLMNPKKQEYFFKEILVKSDYRVIRTFLNSKFLKERMANVKLREECYDKKVLFVAAKEGYTGVARFVLDNLSNAGRILDARVNDGRTILHVAVISNNFDMVKYLVNERKMDLTVKDKFCMTALHMASSCGNLEIVKFLANEKSVDLFARGTFGMTPLHTAANSGHLDIVRFLVDEKHMDVELKDDCGMTVLQTAANSGNLEMVKYLVEEKNADLEAKDEYNLTVLHTAAECGNMELFKFLINEKNADFNAKDTDGLTVLHTAATFCNIEILKCLINEKNADFNVRDKQGRTILHTAGIFGNLEMVKFLVNEKKVDINAKTSCDRTVLHLAVDSGHMDLVKFLVKEKKADLSCQDKFGMTVLHIAATTGNLEMVKFLVDVIDDDFASRDEFGRTVLQTAADSGNVAMATFLMNKREESLEARDDCGMTVLHTAVNSGHVELVKFLVNEKKANINAKDDGGLAVLHTAATFGNLEILKFLINEKGADFNARVSNGKTVLHIAVDSGHLNVVKFLVDEKKVDLKEADKCGVTVFHAAANSGHLEMIKFLLDDRNVDLEVKDRFGMTILNTAANCGRLDIVKYLMNEKKVNFESKDVYGMTVLHSAVISGNFEIVKFMVNEKNVDFEARDDSGMTVLHTAATFGNLQVVKFLANEKMADLNAVANNGKTALHMAADSGNLKVVQFLIDEKGVHLHRLGDGRTLLHAAADSGNLDMVKFLINVKGVDLKTKDYEGATVLHTAAKSGHLDTVKFLVEEKGADFNVKDNHGKSVLHTAAMFGNLDMVKFLINQKSAGLNWNVNNAMRVLPKFSGFDHLRIVKFLIIERGSNFNASDRNDKAALQMAVSFGDLELIEFLVDKKGIDFKAEGNGGTTILRMAAECGNLEVIQFLINEKRCDPTVKKLDVLTALHTAASYGKLEIVQFLINEKQVDFEGRGNVGRTVLHSAADSGSLPIVKFLINEKRADFNVKDNNGATLLHAAAKSGHLDTVKYMVEVKGFDVNARDDRGRSVLLNAANSGNLDIVKYLIYERKADFNKRDINGWTLLNWGHVFGYYRIIEFLKDRENVVPLKKFKYQ